MNRARFQAGRSDPGDRGPTRVRTPKPLTLVQKSALLNLGIVVTALPVLAFAGEPKAVPLLLAILTAISVFIWAATFTVSSFFPLARIFRAQAMSGAKPRLRVRAREAGVVPDPWLDDPL
jgi:hypothetical protein